MELIRLGEPGAWARIKRAQERLSVLEGAILKQSTEKTKAIFGSPLTPAQAVTRILDDVRRDGDKAVFRYTRALDLFELTSTNLRVTRQELVAAAESVSEPFLEAARAAIHRVRSFQEHVKPSPPEPLDSDGAQLTMVYRPYRRVGVYVPGFSASLPSSVIMTVVPAMVAGVKEFAIVTPPNADGNISPAILAVCSLLNIDEIYRIGGAQAVGALAFGTESIPRVDKVVGPGSIFTTLAKRQVFGHCDIDILAGPSEVLIIADESAKAEFVAADLLSQAEHSPGVVFLVTDSDTFAEKVQRELDRQVSKLERQHQIREMLDSYGVVVIAGSLPECASVANEVAPEHLQIQTDDDETVLRMIENAGAIFVGPYTPVAVGDYYAGPSHTLPTGGTARFFSGLSVVDFLRRFTIIRYNMATLRAHSKHIIELAGQEGLTAHARSVQIRLNQEDLR